MSTIAPSNALDHTLLQIQNCGHRIDRVTWKNRLVARLQGGEDLCDYLVRSASFAQALDLKCPDCDAPIDRFFHPAKDTVDQISMAVPELSKERAFLEAQDLILNKNCLGLSQEDLEYCREMADRLPKGEDPRTQRDNFELWWEVIPRGSVIPGEFKTSLEQLKQRLRNLEEDESEPGECAIEFSLDLLEECIAKTVQNWSNPALPYCIALYRLGGMQDRENEIWAALKELKEICRPHPLVDKLFEKLRASVTGFSRCSLSSPAEIGELLKNYPNLQYLEPRFTTKEAFDAFLDILRTSASPLTAIEFDACEYAKNREEMAAILDALRDNKSIRKVSFSGFNSGDCELPIS
ncbi:MAG: hypothetical protein KDK78_07620, partial [Chlamydiia bacterium]|nr:hypothetical protein [Chlamydiia bacterium]